MYYSPGAGADSPQGTKFLCQQKGLITLPIYCKFQRNLLKSDFMQFFHDLIHVFSPGAGDTQPPGRGQNFDVLSLWSSVASFKS